MPFKKGHKGFRKKGEFKHSKNAKIKMSYSHKKYLKTHTHPMLGKHHTEETKKRLSEYFYGRHLSEETKRKISNKLKGREYSEETKKKSSISKMGSKNPNWKGGRKIAYGYIFIKQSSHPRCDKQGYVKKAILIIEQHLGRFLKSKEIVHHVNLIKTDDRIENLMLFKSNSDHIKFHWDNNLAPH